METNSNNIESNMQDIIFKTIYLFLETNDLHDTARSFVLEVKQKFKQDICEQDIPPRALVLRPLNNKRIQAFSDKSSDCKRCTLLFNASESRINESLACPDCKKIAQSYEQYDKLTLLAVTILDSNETMFKSNDIQMLGDSIREMHENHLSLIHMANDITKAISSLSLESKEQIMSKFKKQIQQLYSYPGSHHSLDDIISNASENVKSENSLTDTFIPLESKKMCGNIPTLIDSNSKTTAESSSTANSIFDNLLLIDFDKKGINSTKRCVTLPVLNSAIESRTDMSLKSKSVSTIRTSGTPNVQTPSTDSLQKSSETILEPLQTASQHTLDDNTLSSNEYSKSVTPKRDNPQCTSEVVEITSTESKRSKNRRVLTTTSETSKSATKLSKKPLRETLVDGGSSTSDETMKAEIDLLQLNWTWIKKELLDGDVNTRLKLMQALRWRLTKTDNEQRDKNMMEFVKHDILSINMVPPYGQLFLESYYCPPKCIASQQLQEEIARLINTVASMAMGRLYLERDESLLSVMLIPLLMGKLPGITVYNLTREFTMAAVQKLSLSNRMREVIISNGVVEWLIIYIEKNHATSSAYEAEYSCALLTNLCINKEARHRCQFIPDHVVNVILILINTPHHWCVNYINPIMFSLLLTEVINEKAVASGISARFKDLRKLYGNDEERIRQLDTIIEMHESHEFCECKDAEFDSVTTFTDYLEPELDANELHYGGSEGEEFLKSFQNCGTAIATEKNNLIKRLSSVQIVKKNCTCTNNLRQKKFMKGVEEDSGVVKISNRSRGMRKTSRQGRGKRALQSSSKSPKSKIDRDSNISGSKLNVISKVKANSTSQPVLTRKTSISADRLTKTDTGPPPKGNKKYIVNCCYKMDYHNAINATPGEFVPHPLHTIISEDDCCTCYEDIKEFAKNIMRDDDTSADSKTNLDMTIKCSSCRNTVPVLQVKNFGSEDQIVRRYRANDVEDGKSLHTSEGSKSRTKKLQFSSYQIVSDGTER